MQRWKRRKNEAENAPAAAKGLEVELRTEGRARGRNEAQQQPASSPVGSRYGTLLQLASAAEHACRQTGHTDEAEWRAARVLSYDAHGGTSGSWRVGMAPRAQAPALLGHGVARRARAGRGRRVDGRRAHSRAPGGGAAAVHRRRRRSRRQMWTAHVSIGCQQRAELIVGLDRARRTQDMRVPILDGVRIPLSELL